MVHSKRKKDKLGSLDWNTPAIEFYKSEGAIIKKKWRVVHFPEKEINKYKDYS